MRARKSEKEAIDEKTIVRKLKVHMRGSYKKRGYSIKPTIKLHGRWLHKVGFIEGQVVYVTASQGKLLIHH